MEGLNYCRMTQEALNISIKHSETEQMGNGLGNMRNRAERIGRELKIDSALGQGTQVCIF